MIAGQHGRQIGLAQSSIFSIGALWLIAFVTRLATALPMNVPGYMDAYYYFVGAQRLVEGYGLTEPYLWNYLGPVQTLPAPAFQFWLPLTSFIMWPFLVAFGVTFRAGQMPFIILSSFLPLIAYRVGRILGLSSRGALTAGLLTTFAPFYIKYWVATDNFTPFALIGSLSLLAMWHAIRRGQLAWYALAGALVGLSHWARADAPLLLITLLLVAIWGHNETQPRPARPRPFATLAGWLVAVGGYLAVISPWYLYTYLISGRLASAGAQSIFLTSYDDLYSYGKPLTWHTYWAWGLGPILQSKLQAAGANLITVMVVFLSAFLAPFVALEMWIRRRELLVRLVALYGVLLYLTMTLIFTFPGPRGSLLHSGSALLPFLLPLAVCGLERSVDWVAQRRSTWDSVLAKRVFSAGAVALCMVLSAFIYARALWASGDASQAWNTRDEGYRLAGVWLAARGVPAETPVLVGNPPAFYYYTRRYALAIPNGPPDTVAEVCQRFGARYLLLELNRPAPLDALWDGRQEHPALSEVYRWTGSWQARLYACRP